MNKNKINLLNNNSIYSLSDYQQLQLAKSYDEIYNKTIKENKKNITENENNKIYNLSLKTLGINFFTNWTNIINDFVELINNKEKKNFSDYINIIVKNDRLIYFINVEYYFIYNFLCFINFIKIYV